MTATLIEYPAERALCTTWSSLVDTGFGTGDSKGRKTHCV